MRAVQIDHYGGSDGMRLNEVPVPELKPDEVLVRIRAASVNPVDWLVREGLYKVGPQSFPMTLGQDFSGVVEKIGDQVGRFKVGDEVYGQAWGSYADYAAVPEKDLANKPRRLDFVESAAVPLTALTAWQAIEAAGVAPGQSVLIHGAGGGLGAFAAQFAKLRGARVIATASPVNFDFLKSIGVDQIIDYRTQRFEDLVQDIDVVLDPLGGDVQNRSWKVLKKGGKLVNFVGEIDQEAARQFGVGTIEFGVEYDISDLEEIGKLIDAGKVKTHVSKVLDLKQAKAAMDLNQQGNSHGKVVLKVA